MKTINDLTMDSTLKIIQIPKVTTFSLDSVLLAYFAQTNKASNILDLCTGNSPVPLLLSKKTSKNALIEGVEIQREIFLVGQESVQLNNLEDKIKLHNM